MIKLFGFFSLFESQVHMGIIWKIDHFDLFACFVFRVEPDPVASMVPTLVEPVPVVTGNTNHVTWTKN